MLRVLVILVVIVAVAVIGGYVYRKRMLQDRVVRLVVPDGYRKIFRLVVDPTADQPTQEGGVWVYRIPEGGVARIRDRHPFADWHRTTAVYASGKALDAAPLPPAAPYREDIRVHSAGSTSRPDGSQIIEFFVGTDREMLEIAKQSDHPLGSVTQ